MTQQQVAKLPLRQCSILKGHPSFKHFVTDRNNGVSTGNYESLNLSYASGDEPSRVDTNRTKLVQSLNISVNHLYIPRQTHSNSVAIVDKDTDVDSLRNTDGLITATTGICIAVLVADCVPILLFDPINRIAGVVHAGWRGTCSGIVQNVVQLMQASFLCKAENIKAAIGPSISPDVYEVGAEVIDAFRQNFRYTDQLITPSPNPGKYLLNLWRANQLQLMDMGVPQSSIEIAGICTYQNEHFFSARRMGVQCGRFASGCMLVE